MVPEARGRGIAGKLLAHALADAAERGLETSTLVATPLGRPVYERLGYREFGRSRCGNAAAWPKPAGRLRADRSPSSSLLEHDLALQRAVHGALRGDLHEPLALVLRQLLGKLNANLNRVGEPRCAGS